MPLWGWTLVVVGAVLFLGLLMAWSYAARIDRLHRRLASARLGLDRHLVRRSAEALRISESRPAQEAGGSSLHEAATTALLVSQFPLAPDTLGGFARQGAGSQDDAATRLAAESTLSWNLRETLDVPLRAALEEDPLTRVQLQSLDDACNRVRVARNLHNQDVLQVRALRGKPLVRLAHLAGSAPMPQFVDFDDLS